MLSVYFENKAITFNDRHSEEGGEDFDVSGCHRIPVAKVLQKLENIKCLNLISENPVRTFDLFLSEFEVLDAAGGLVDDGNGNILLISRNRRWDIPKGHRELFESLEECAVREVGEETGLTDVTIYGYIITTYHFYKLKGVWTMKHTAWYKMKYTGSETPVPQWEEGIDKVCWIPVGEAAECMRRSFLSVRTVIDEALRTNNQI